MTKRERILAGVAALAIMVAGVSSAMWWRERGDAGPGCFEDQVIMWSGERHDRCVPTDELRAR
jgi:hypothetical protein